jgi:hypothetical protein
MVVELSDGIARRQALDASLFGRDMLVVRYDEWFGGCVHCTPNAAPIVAQSVRVEDTLGLACKALAARRGPDYAGRFIFS